MQEREVKLAVPVGFELPELGGPDDGFLAEPQAPRRMRVVYYDTPDLRLARWGASLRHRSGEGWTVKLPGGREGAMLVRGEHVFPGDGRKPPQEAVDLVRAFVRGGQLSPVVRMRTLRRPVELRDQAGAPLAEIVDDEVQVLDGSRISSRIGEDPEAVHQARVATRRLRSTLRTFRNLLEPEWTTRLRDELKWLADLLGAVRDADVLLARLQGHLAALPEADAQAGQRLLRSLVERREADRERLLGAMGEPRYATLLDGLVAAAAAPALLPGADQPADEVMPPLVAKPWRKLRKTVRSA